VEGLGGQRLRSHVAQHRARDEGPLDEGQLDDVVELRRRRRNQRRLPLVDQQVHRGRDARSDAERLEQGQALHLVGVVVREHARDIAAHGAGDDVVAPDAQLVQKCADAPGLHRHQEPL